jgi:asparagine synthetase B (glutamine-hydrolysing)
MGRSDLLRVNKTFMRHGVECRTPFFDRELIEGVLTLGKKECPPGKGLLKAAVADLLPEEILARKKLTFQGASGVALRCEEIWGPEQRKVYNAVARDLYGAVPRG